MNLAPIFEEDKRYSPSELAELFDVTRHTIRNWAEDDRLQCDRTADGRIFIGHQVMRDVKNSEHLQKTLREAHMAENDQEENDYVQSLEQTVEELQSRLEAVEEERDQLRDQSMEVIGKLADKIDRQDEKIESLESTVENRLPDPQDNEDTDDGSWWFW